MPLLKEHEVYHKLGPKDVLKAEPVVLDIGILKQTNNTGEQFQVNCPVYASDDREALKTRFNMLLSIMQDRMEDENTALLRMQEEMQEKAAAKKAEADAEQAKRKAEHQAAKAAKKAK